MLVEGSGQNGSGFVVKNSAYKRSMKMRFYLSIEHISLNSSQKRYKT